MQKLLVDSWADSPVQCEYFVAFWHTALLQSSQGQYELLI